jgi:hypothetical protein
MRSMSGLEAGFEPAPSRSEAGGSAAELLQHARLNDRRAQDVADDATRVNADR